MRGFIGLPHARQIAAGVVLGLAVACAACARGTSYVGKWQCPSGSNEFLEIRANGGAFLVTDEKGATIPAALDDKGTLVVSGIPMLGTLPLPIDTASGDLICSICSCHRLTRQRAADAAAAAAPAVDGSQVTSSAKDDASAQAETMAMMRNAGTALFSWLTDQAGAAAAGEQMVDLAQIPLSSFDAMKKLLVPKYIQNLPERDGWGNSFEYRLDAKNMTGKSVMSIRSPGRDGKFSEENYSVGGFARTDYDHDIVWADGYFVQWPK